MWVGADQPADLHVANLALSVAVVLALAVGMLAVGMRAPGLMVQQHQHRRGINGRWLRMHTFGHPEL